MNATIAIPEKVYSDVARYISDTAEDNHDGTMTFCLLDEEFEDKDGIVYSISAAGQIHYIPTHEEWGDDYWVNGVSFNYGFCEILNEDGDPMSNDFNAYILEKYIC